MSLFNIELITPNDEQINQVIDEISRKYSGMPLTPQVEDDLQCEAEHLILQLIKTKITLVKGE